MLACFFINFSFVTYMPCFLQMCVLNANDKGWFRIRFRFFKDTFYVAILVIGSDYTPPPENKLVGDC